MTKTDTVDIRNWFLVRWGMWDDMDESPEKNVPGTALTYYKKR